MIPEAFNEINLSVNTKKQHNVKGSKSKHGKHHREIANVAGNVKELFGFFKSL